MIYTLKSQTNWKRLRFLIEKKLFDLDRFFSYLLVLVFLDTLYRIRVENGHTFLSFLIFFNVFLI